MAGARLPPRRVGPSRVGPGITHVQFREASADSLNKIVILGAQNLPTRGQWTLFTGGRVWKRVWKEERAIDSFSPTETYFTPPAGPDPGNGSGASARGTL